MLVLVVVLVVDRRSQTLLSFLANVGTFRHEHGRADQLLVATLADASHHVGEYHHHQASKRGECHGHVRHRVE